MCCMPGHVQAGPGGHLDIRFAFGLLCSIARKCCLPRCWADWLLRPKQSLECVPGPAMQF